MNQQKTHIILTYLITLVWLANGLFCKVLNLVPRHQEIVERILGNTHSRTITIMIGGSEILMAIWVLSQEKSKVNAITQIVIVCIMNILELIFAADLLLWSEFNSLFALLFILIVYYTNFKLQKKHVVIS